MKDKNYYNNFMENFKRDFGLKYKNENSDNEDNYKDYQYDFDLIKNNKWVKYAGYTALGLLGVFLAGKIFKVFSKTVDGFNMLKKSIKNQN